MNKQEQMNRIAEYCNLLEKAHELGTSIRKDFQELDVTRVEDQDLKTGMTWRIAESVAHVGTAQTYAGKLQYYVNNHLKGEEV